MNTREAVTTVDSSKREAVFKKAFSDKLRERAVNVDRTEFSRRWISQRHQPGTMPVLVCS